MHGKLKKKKLQNDEKLNELNEMTMWLRLFLRCLMLFNNYLIDCVVILV